VCRPNEIQHASKGTARLKDYKTLHRSKCRQSQSSLLRINFLVCVWVTVWLWRADCNELCPNLTVVALQSLSYTRPHMPGLQCRCQRNSNVLSLTVHFLTSVPVLLQFQNFYWQTDTDGFREKKQQFQIRLSRWMGLSSCHCGDKAVTAMTSLSCDDAMMTMLSSSCQRRCLACCQRPW